MASAAQRWTLAFRDEALEREFQLDIARSGVRQHRIAWSIMALLSATAVPADRAATGTAANFHVWVAVRFGFSVPIFIAVAALGWLSLSRFARHRQAAVAVGAATLFWAHVLTYAFLLPDPELFQYRESLFPTAIAILLVYGVLVSRLVVALIVALPANACLVLVLAWRAPELDLGPLVFLFVAANAVGALGLWQVEQSRRQAFVANRRADALLHNMLPAAIAERLKDGPSVIAEHFDQVTVLFADIVGFTSLSTTLPPARLVELLNRVFTRFDELAARHRVEKIKTIGDAYMVVAGLPVPRADHAAAAADMALDLRAAIGELSQASGHPLRVRIGLCTGPAVAGVIGIQKFAYDLWGDTVNTAARMESHGTPGEIHVTESTQQLLRDRYALDDCGMIEVKGKGPMRTYFLRTRLG